jgi:hypothetical protein
VTIVDVVGLAVLLVFVLLMLIMTLIGRRRTPSLRPLAGIESLGKAVERTVEAGEQVHLSLGTGSVTGPNVAPALAGLSALTRVATATAVGDKPLVVTAGDGAMTVLAQDTLRDAYERIGRSRAYRHTAARMLGATPFSYAAGVPLLLSMEGTTVHLLLGSFGVEGALAADAGERGGAFVLGGTDDVRTQALLYAAAGYPLVGEEIFATGAYLEGGGFHQASLRVQDAVRVLVIVAVALGTILLSLGVSL